MVFLSPHHPKTVAMGYAKAAFFQQILASVLREKKNIKPPILSDVFQHLVIGVWRPHFAKKEKIVVQREMLIIFGEVRGRVVVVIAAALTVVRPAVLKAKRLNLGRQENVFEMIYVIQVQNVRADMHMIMLMILINAKAILVEIIIAPTVTMVNAKAFSPISPASALPEKQNMLVMIIFPVSIIGTCTTVFLLIILVDV